MNNGLRGFDLGYFGGLQSHLISSWDGNAIRVSTIERFDGSQWHHVALTYDGSSRASGLKIYLDGALATIQTAVDRLSDTIRSDFPFAIGGRERRDYYQGSVDEVRAFNRVLSADEIFELYDLERSNVNPSPGSSLETGPRRILAIRRRRIARRKPPRQERSRPRRQARARSRRCPKSSKVTAARPCGSRGFGNHRLRPGRRFRPHRSLLAGHWFKPRGDGFKSPDGNHR